MIEASNPPLPDLRIVGNVRSETGKLSEGLSVGASAVIEVAGCGGKQVHHELAFGRHGMVREDEERQELKRHVQHRCDGNFGRLRLSHFLAFLHGFCSPGPSERVALDA